jgi:uncharacterized membrane protein
MAAVRTREYRCKGRVFTLRMEEDPMIYGWIALVIVFWALGMSVVIILMRMAGDQDRAARHSEKELFPFSDVSVTGMGPWRD